MSKARVSDAERTRILTELVRAYHEPPYDPANPSGLSTVVLEEVRAGWRYADVLALGVWKNTGLRLDGFEIKASRADLKRELADPSKHESAAKYCNRWSLVVWDAAVLKDVDGIPETWGLLVGHRDAYDEWALETVRKPTPLTPQPWPRKFVCSLVRNAYEQAPSSAFVARAVMQAHQHARREYLTLVEQKLRSYLLPLAEYWYGRESWKWKPADVAPDALIARAVTDLRGSNDGN